MLPFSPESIEQLRARYPAAIARVFDYGKLEEGGIPDYRPGLMREHVFDFPTGLRLVISVDDYGEGTILHVSASACPNTQAHRCVMENTSGFHRFCQAAEQHFEAIAGRSMPAYSYRTFPQGIPHWAGKMEDNRDA